MEKPAMSVHVKEEQMSDNEVETGKEIVLFAVKQEVKNEPFEDLNAAERAQQRVYVKEEEPAEYLLIIPPKEEPKEQEEENGNQATASEDREFKCDYFDCDFVGKTRKYYLQHQEGHTELFESKDCQKRFSERREQNRHRLVKHEDPNALQCKVCSRNLCSNQSLKFHLETHEKNPAKPFKCLKCEKAFRFQQELKRHQKIIHSNFKPFACDLCPKKFAVCKQIRKHVESHKVEKKYKCKVCSKSFVMKPQFDDHMERHAGIKLKCDLCDAELATKQALKYHKINVHSNQSLKCEKCDFVAKCSTILNQHQRVHKEWTKADAVECPQCSKICPNKKSLWGHIRQVHSEKQFECDFMNCNFVVKTEAELKSHQRSHEKKFECNICERLFSSKTQLTRHNLIKHENSDRFKCHVCDKRFFSKQSLQQHLPTHEEQTEKKFSCEECSMSFRSKNALKSHKLNIHAFRSFICDLCPSKQARLFTMRRHMKSHMQEKEFKCERCSVQFVRKGRCEDHMRQNNGKQLMKCTICSFKSCTKLYLALHVKNVHSK